MKITVTGSIGNLNHGTGFILGSHDIGSAIHSGTIRKDYDSTNPVPFGKVKFEAFAKEFATNYKK